tara:strand:+ start:144 stop:551 length:408 start_codon:yes stop_codon:yes gene_type:complete
MAIPSGSGSEVLRNFGIEQNGAGATALVDFGGTTGTGSVRTSGNTSGVVAVPANVIITMINITCTAGNSGHTIYGEVDWQGSGTGIRIFMHYPLNDNETFVFNDKIVLREGDKLKLYNSVAQCDWSGSFIYQDWT